MILELALVTTQPYIKKISRDVSDNYAVIFDKNYSQLFYNDWYLLCKSLMTIIMAEFDISMDKPWTLWIKNNSANTCVYIDNCVSSIDYKMIRK